VKRLLSLAFIILGLVVVCGFGSCGNTEVNVDSHGEGGAGGSAPTTTEVPAN
jgi:hypothetical protein